MGTSGLRASRYNVVVGHGRRKLVLVYNTRTGVIVQAPEAYRGVLESLLASSSGTTAFPRRITGLLEKAGCLIPADEDELESIQAEYEECLHRKVLVVSLMPTLACNFACKYCFERHRPTHMGDREASSVIEFLRKNGERGASLSLDWYGGEPLLRLGFVLDLQRRIVDTAVGLAMSACYSVTTNGYLLTPKACDALVRAGISSFQITLDGPALVHDSRRPTAEGGPTFSRIMEHVCHASQVAKVNLRVNVDRENAPYLGKLLGELSSRGIHDRVRLLFKAVVPAGGRPTTGDCYSMNEFLKAVAGTVEAAEAQGFQLYEEPLCLSEFCPVDLPNQWIIGPDLLVYKCADAFDCGTDPVGRLTDSGDVERFPGLAKWLKKPVFSDPACRACVFLPQCMGGCALKKLVHQRDWCPEERFALDEQVRRIYERRSVPCSRRHAAAVRR
jgi:uncharacterized protein